MQRSEADSWQIVKMMAYGHLGLVQVDKFDIEQFPGYQSFGYRSLNKGFHASQGTIHVFQTKIFQKLLYPSMYKHDLSFWLSPIFNQTDLENIINEVSGKAVTEIENIDDYFCETKQLRSKTIRLTYCSHQTVLSFNDVMNLHVKIGKALEERINVSIR